MTDNDNRVAIVVFLTVDDGDNLGERQSAGELAVWQALHHAGHRNRRNLTLPVRFNDDTESTVDVHEVRELGRTMASGAVWAQPSWRPYPADADR